MKHALIIFLLALTMPIASHAGLTGESSNLIEMSGHHNTYCIVPDADVTQDMIDAHSGDVVRLRHTTIGEDLVIFKWKTYGGNPAIFDAYTKYTYAEIKVEIAKDKWKPVEP